jgi:hypothetical protein
VRRKLPSIRARITMPAKRAIPASRLKRGTIPTEETCLAEAHASELGSSCRERDVRRDALDHIGTALGIQNVVHPAEEMRKGLAVSAVANDAIDTVGMGHRTLEGSAAAA